MRLASYNVENLFARAKALNTTTFDQGREVLAAFERFNTIAGNAVYTDQDKADLLTALQTLGVLVRDQAGRLGLSKRPFDAWALLRENRGDFLVAPANADARIVADGRGAWIGWVELVTEAVDEIGTRMTAKVIAEVAADVLCVVEAEDRPSLVRFDQALLGGRYAHCMLIDGNDPRGIDVGMYCTDAVDVRWVRSHVDVPDPGAGQQPKALFSRDAPVYHLRVGGADLFVVVNHLKSQSFSSGNPDPLRRRQSEQVRKIYDGLRAEGADFVAVLGDLNKGPSNDVPPKHPTLEALLGPGSPLVDAYSLPVFDAGPRPGSFQSCTLRNRLDYILMSPELAAKVTAGGVFRSGLWGDPGNVNPPTLWEVFPEITSAKHAASDHAAIWVDIDF